jgi:uncharacterized protein (DUF58 family)
VTDARRLTLVPPPARQGPGALPDAAVARVDLTLRRRAAGVLPGDHRTPGAGDGTELAQLRPYEVGDDPRRLDAAATARTGVPHVRLQVPERAITTWLVLDVSPSMAFGTRDRLKSDVAEGVAEVIGRSAVRRGGRIAVALAGAGEPLGLPPRGGRGALAGLRRLTASGVAPDAGDAATASPPARPHDLAAALDRVGRLARSRGAVFVVSDFRDDGWSGPLRALAGRHDVTAVEITDPLEAELPAAGHLVLVDPERGELVEADTSSAELREAYAAAESARRDALVTTLRRAGAAHVVLSTAGEWLRDLGRGMR